MTSVDDRLAESRAARSRAALAHAVSPRTWREALALGRADATIAPAVRVGLAATVVLVAGGLLGRPDLAALATLGAVSSAFGRYEAYRRRAAKLTLIGVLVLVYSTLGAALGAAHAPVSVQILAICAGGGVAAWLVTGFAVTGPGPVILVFAAVAAEGFASSWEQVPVATAATTAGAVIGWLTAMFPALMHPVGPAQLAVARALAALERQLAAPSGPSASGSIAAARTVIALGAPRSRRAPRGPSNHDRTLTSLLDDAQSVVDALERGEHVERPEVLDHQRALRRIRRFEASAIGSCGTERPHRGIPDSLMTEGLLTEGLLTEGLRRLRSRSLIANSVRMTAAAAASALLATAVGFSHPLWAAMGAVAAMQGVTFGVTVSRGVQRLIGNIVGAVLAAGVLALSLGYWQVAVAVVIAQVAAELTVLINYTLTSIAITPMALLLTGLATELEPSVAWIRIGDTAIGVFVGIAVAALTLERSDHGHLPASMSRTA